MSVQSVGNQVDIQRAKAEKFVNASDKTINRLARKTYNRMYGDENKKFDKRVGTTLKTLPLVAVASGLAMKQGARGSLLSGLTWGLALAAPAMVGAVNKAMVKSSRTVEKAERKHPMTALVTNMAASVGAFFGLTALANKALANPKVAEVGGKVVKGAGEVLGKAKAPVQSLLKKTKIPGAVAGAMMYAETLSVPKPVAKVLETPVAKSIGSVVKKASKYVAKNAPTLLVFGTLGAVLAKGASEANKMKAVHSGIKEAQFNTAKALVNSYAAENAELKAENAKVAEAETEEAAE